MRDGGGIDKRVEGERERLRRAPRERSTKVSRLGLDDLLYTKREGLRLSHLYAGMASVATDSDVSGPWLL
jgi:hypothetical protein